MLSFQDSYSITFPCLLYKKGITMVQVVYLTGVSTLDRINLVQHYLVSRPGVKTFDFNLHQITYSEP